MKLGRTVLLLVSVILLTACAAPATNAAKLSAAIDQQVENNHQAYLQLVNQYYQAREKNINNDTQLQVNQVIQHFSATQPHPTKQDYQRLSEKLQSLVEKNTQATKALNETEWQTVLKLLETHDRLRHATRTLTEYLNSEVALHQAQRRLVGNEKGGSHE